MSLEVKKPRRWDLIICNETLKPKEVRQKGEGGIRCNDHKVEVVESSYAKQLQDQNHSLQKKLSEIESDNEDLKRENQLLKDQIKGVKSIGPIG